METQEQAQYVNQDVDITQSNGMPVLEDSASDSLPKLPPATEPTTNTQWQEFSDKVGVFLERLPEYVGRFFNQYKSQITSVALIFAALISVKIVLAILDAVNDIPLIAFFFELVGISYAVWFISRYLLKVSTRQELASEINSFKKQIIGNEDTFSEN
jgi:CAAD domains of cyanobacterial aminoacyl-tRNA synthetase